MSFDGKSVMITGAGKGIGRETARFLASKGASIVALSRTQEDLDSLRDEIGGTMIAVDLADAEAARAAAREGLPAELLVNCAGINVLQSFVDVTVDAFDLVHAVNTRAAMIVAQEYARARIARWWWRHVEAGLVVSEGQHICFEDPRCRCRRPCPLLSASWRRRPGPISAANK